MRDISKQVALLANIATILLVIVLGLVLVKRFVLPGTSQREDVSGAQVGSKIALPDVDWSRSSKNLVLVLQKGCHYCAESAPFYQRLAREAASHNDLKLIAAFPQRRDEAKQYLSDLRVPIDEVRQASLSSFGVKGTPTLIIVNASGAIEAVWAGKLPPEKENEVLHRLNLE